ncbi:hypothetical protein COCNU_scaffold003116G000090 [Cocos nucifera]|nr:hypothetical protein [Cocos nucifera]
MVTYFIFAAFQVLVFIAILYAKNASGYESDEVNYVVEDQPPKWLEAEIDLTTQQSNLKIHEQYHRSQAETSYGGEDECPTIHMLQNLPEEEEQNLTETMHSLQQMQQQQQHPMVEESAPHLVPSRHSHCTLQ